MAVKSSRNKATRNKGGGSAHRVPSEDLDPVEVAEGILAAADTGSPRALHLELLRVAARVFGKAEKDRSYTPAASMLRQIREIAHDLQALDAAEAEQNDDPRVLLAQIVDEIRAMPDVAREQVMAELSGAVH